MWVLALNLRSSVFLLSGKNALEKSQNTHILGHSSGMMLGHLGFTFKDTTGSITWPQDRQRGPL